MNNSVDSHARSMSIRAKANYLAKKTGISPQAALQAYFTERFLARLSRSEYASSMIIKGGTLMSSLLGIAERTTMDIDATLIGSPGNEAGIRSVVEKICCINADDGITFSVNEIEQIRKDDEYGGFGFSLIATLGTIRLSIGIDVTVGDTITPAPTSFDYKHVLDDDNPIRLLAYTTETLLAEKLQTLLKRGAMTTRPRDFYDIYKIEASGRYDGGLLVLAVEATFRNRKSESLLPRRYQILETIRRSKTIHEMWKKYQKQFPYASDISLEMALASAKRLFDHLPTPSE